MSTPLETLYNYLLVILTRAKPWIAFLKITTFNFTKM